MTGNHEPLSRPYGPSDLEPLITSVGVNGTVVVQARQELAETAALLDFAANTEWIRGVVGWVDLTSPEVNQTIDGILRGTGGTWLVGFRHVVHDEPNPNWLIRDDVCRGLEAVAESGLTFDLLVRTRELPAAVTAAKRFPDLRFVVDHLAKPPVSTGGRGDWSRAIREIAVLPNVSCKVSGLVTEADWSSWTEADLTPYVATVLQEFGADRMMWGSDWPVCTLVATYSEVYESSVRILDELVGDKLPWVLGGCATETYRLDS
jgi:L-fuconolactonase